jgi:DNA-binding IclR family transcriptional regulator
VASVILDHASHPVASVAITFPADEVPPARRDYLATHVARTAAAISRRIGG